MPTKDPVQRKAIQKRYREKHKEKLALQNREYAKKNPEIYRKATREYYARNRDSIIAKNYGLTVDEYYALGDSCDICNSTDRLCVDHNHETGEVRGLLCNGCNIGLGGFKDDKESLLKAIKYLDGKINERQ